MPKNITWTNWSANDEKRYSMLYSYLKTKIKDLDEFTFIDDKKRGIMSQIENNKNWANTTKEGIFFMVAKYLKASNDLRYGKLYSQKGYDFLIENRKKESKNKQDDKEIENYRSHEFLLNVIDTINPESITTKKAHLQYLLLNMLVLQPPIRTDYYVTAKFIFTEKENDNINNFIWITKRGKLKVNYIVNKDKVSKTKVYNMNKKLSTISIENDKLVKLINESYKKYPRNYLLEIDDKPITHATFLEWLRKITDVKLINNDIMRSSYINWFYDHHKGMDSREKLALQMRHSVMTSLRNYRKIIEEKPIEKPVDELKLENEVLNNKLINCESENKLTDAKYNKRRRDIIYKINNKNVTPKESTLDKYNIIYDDIKEKYI
jgi:hypothetical protein